jgi:hypothetical protein
MGKERQKRLPPNSLQLPILAVLNHMSIALLATLSSLKDPSIIWRVLKEEPIEIN